MARMGANGQPMPEKKSEVLQEILEVNPNAVEENILSDEPEMEEDNENEEL